MELKEVTLGLGKWHEARSPLRCRSEILEKAESPERRSSYRNKRLPSILKKTTRSFELSPLATL